MYLIKRYGLTKNKSKFFFLKKPNIKMILFAKFNYKNELKMQHSFHFLINFFRKNIYLVTFII